MNVLKTFSHFLNTLPLSSFLSALANRPQWLRVQQHGAHAVAWLASGWGAAPAPAQDASLKTPSGGGCADVGLSRAPGRSPRGGGGCPSPVSRSRKRYTHVASPDLPLSCQACPCGCSLWSCVGSRFSSSDYLCIWNTNFQTLQAGKEMAGRIYGQVSQEKCSLVNPFNVLRFSCVRKYVN